MPRGEELIRWTSWYFDTMVFANLTDAGYRRIKRYDWMAVNL